MVASNERGSGVRFGFRPDDQVVRAAEFRLQSTDAADLDIRRWEPVRDIVLSVTIDDEESGASLLFHGWTGPGGGAATPILEFCYGLTQTLMQLNGRQFSTIELPEFGTCCTVRAAGDVLHVEPHSGLAGFTTSGMEFAHSVERFRESVRDYLIALAPSLSSTPRIPIELRSVVFAR